MKKFTKVALIIAVVFVTLGVACLIGSVALGSTWGTWVNMVKEGKFSFGIGNINYYGTSSVEIKEDINNLDIEIDAGTLEIYYDDVDRIQVKQENIARFKYYVKNDTLHIECGRKWGISSSNGRIVVEIPQDKSFRKAELEVGAGVADVDGLIADSVKVEVGAGRADIKNLTVKNLNADTGTGQINVELYGKEEDYSYKLECGIGQIRIGNSSYSGLGNEQKLTNPGAIGVLKIECGVGQVNVEFK